MAPEGCTQAEFTRALAASFGRRAWLRVPAGALRLAMGEMSELLLGGVPMVPAAALGSGYRFRYPQLEGRWPHWRQARSRRRDNCSTMKVLDLCCSSGHPFEGWFASESDFQQQNERGFDRMPAVR